MGIDREALDAARNALLFSAMAIAFSEDDP